MAGIPAALSGLFGLGPWNRTGVYCGRCGWAVVPGDAGCRKCGVSYGPQWGQSPGHLARSAASGKGTNKLAALAAGLAGLLAVGFAMNGIRQSALAQPGKSPAAQLVSQSEQVIPQLLSAAGVPAARPMLASQNIPADPQLQASLETSGLPANVASWLAHLGQIEAKRADLAARQASEAAGVYSEMLSTKGVDMNRLAEGDLDAIPEDKTAKSREVAGQTRDIGSGWQGLAREFASVPPPSECQALASNYAQLLSGTESMVKEIGDALDMVQSDPQAALGKVMAMQGQSSRRVDAFAKAADRALGALCNRYRADKPFDIQSDFGGGLMASR